MKFKASIMMLNDNSLSYVEIVIQTSQVCQGVVGLELESRAYFTFAIRGCND